MTSLAEGQDTDGQLSAVDGDGARAVILTTPGGHLDAMFRPFSESAATL